jgi:hypothetical protein
LRCQCAGPVEKFGNVIDAAVDNLQRADSIIRVTDTLCEDGNVRPECVGDCQAGRIVAACRDTES